MVYFRFRRATNLCLQVKETPSPGWSSACLACRAPFWRWSCLLRPARSA